jgi:hypothetical protein
MPGQECPFLKLKRTKIDGELPFVSEPAGRLSFIGAIG